jgi:hypothetical protein
MDRSPTLYRLREIRDRHIILQSPTGGMRVLSADGLTEGIPIQQGVKFTLAGAAYTVSADDYERIKDYLANPVETPG